MTCVVSEGDGPVKITWLKDGHPLKPREATTHQIDEYDLALRIASASPMHNGNYTCLASNDAAKVFRTAPLLVHGTNKCDPKNCFTPHAQLNHETQVHFFTLKILQFCQTKYTYLLFFLNIQTPFFAPPFHFFVFYMKIFHLPLSPSVHLPRGFHIRTGG